MQKRLTDLSSHTIQELLRTAQQRYERAGLAADCYASAIVELELELARRDVAAELTENPVELYRIRPPHRQRLAALRLKKAGVAGDADAFVKALAFLDRAQWRWAWRLSYELRPLTKVFRALRALLFTALLDEADAYQAMTAIEGLLSDANELHHAVLALERALSKALKSRPPKASLLATYNHWKANAALPATSAKARRS